MATVGILLATYNGEKYVLDQLHSLLQQTMEDWHCYIHDDGSIDETVTVLQEFIAKNPDKFSLLEYRSTGSAKANFLSMLHFTQEPYVMFCDQDDIWIPKKIEMTFEKMLLIEKSEHNIPAVVFTDLTVVDEDLTVISNSFFDYCKLSPENCYFERFLGFNVIAGCTMMINRCTADIAMKGNPANIYMHDWWCGLIASSAGKIGGLNIPTILYRQHGSNSIGAEKKKNLILKLKEGLLIKTNREKTKGKYILKRKQARELINLNILSVKQKTIAEQFYNLHVKSIPRRLIFCKNTLHFGAYAALECSLTAIPIETNNK